MANEKTLVDDINRDFYDFRYEENEKDFYRIESGLTPEIVAKISEEKGDPQWMREFRLKSLEIYNSLRVPEWGPCFDDLNISNIATYVRPKTNMSGKWEDVPDDIKVIKCKDCGKPVCISIFNDKTIRCEDCQKKADYTPIGDQIKVCPECRKQLIASSKSKTDMCKECYETYRRKRKTEVMNMLRNK